jgi:hypothetical protein
VIFKIYRTWIYFDFCIARMIYPKETSIFTTDIFSSLVLEILLEAIHPNIWLSKYTFEVYNSSVELFLQYTVNDALSIVAIVIKLYYIIKAHFLSSEFNSNKMQRLV